MVRLMGVVPSLTRTMAFVVHPAGAVLACACMRVTVMALSRVQLSAVHVEVNAPGKNIFRGPRGLAESVSEPMTMPGENVCSCDQVWAWLRLIPPGDAAKSSHCKLAPFKLYWLKTQIPGDRKSVV